MYDLETCGSPIFVGRGWSLLSGCVQARPTGQSRRRKRQGGGPSATLFTLVDTNKNGAVTREELKGTFDTWYTEWDKAKGNALTLEQVFFGVGSAFPAAAAGGRGARQRRTRHPRPEDVTAMMAALPDSAPVKPKQPRKVLVLAKAAGFVHSSIPLAARTIEEIGKKTGAWSTTITYDAADINDANLKQYDAIFLASTTGAFLDDPSDAAATAARRKALLDFVRGGKGLAGIHAASDSYHRSSAPAAGGRGGAINFADPAGRDADGRRRSEQRRQAVARRVHRPGRHLVRQVRHRQDRQRRAGGLSAALRRAAAGSDADRARRRQRAGGRRPISVPTRRSARGRSSTR